MSFVFILCCWSFEALFPVPLLLLINYTLIVLYKCWSCVCLSLLVSRTSVLLMIHEYCRETGMSFSYSTVCLPRFWQIVVVCLKFSHNIVFLHFLFVWLQHQHLFLHVFDLLSTSHHFFIHTATHICIRGHCTTPTILYCRLLRNTMRAAEG